MKISERHRGTRFGSTVMGATLAGVIAGCSTTQQVKVSGNPETYCPFLGSDICAKLTATDAPGRFSGAAAQARGWWQYQDGGAVADGRCRERHDGLVAAAGEPPLVLDIRHAPAVSAR
jgi:hypothetical protein